MSREVALDIESSGYGRDHRVIEIGCVELPAGRIYQTYLNPESGIHENAFKLHGLTAEFLVDKPLFADIADTFMDFIGDDRLVIHNASFDIRFINMELVRLGRPIIQPDRVIDTMQIAKHRWPGAPCSLEALCKRFDIDPEGQIHGALADALLLAKVYLKLVG